MKKNDYVAVDKASLEELADSLAYLNNKTLNTTTKLVKELDSANLQHNKINKIKYFLIITASILFFTIGFFLGLYKGTDLIKRYILDDKIFINKQLQDEIELYKFKTANLEKKYQKSERFAKILRDNDISLYYQDAETYLSLPIELIEKKFYGSKNNKVDYLKFTSKFDNPETKNLFFIPEN